jgi:hypothetical protein
MCWDLWSFGIPFIADEFRAPAKPAGRADFLLGVIRDAPTAPAGDMGLLVSLSH